MKDSILFDYWWASQECNYMKPLKKMAEEAGSTEKLFEMDERELIRIKGITPSYAEEIIRRRKKWNLEKEYQKAVDLGVKFIPYYDLRYPRRLLKISGYPFAIFVIGDVPDDNKPCVGIVGARNCSEYGRTMAERLGRELALFDAQTVSGMAYGIDGLSQLATIKNGGKSFGILGCGVDVCYPRSNFELYERLKICGGLISEYGIGTMAQSRLFPPRNRIISALCDVLVVVEARKKSGTGITVDMALEQGRDIAIVPGRVTDELSMGCNEMWKQGAVPVTCAEDIMYMINPTTYLDNETSAGKRLRIEREREENRINALSDDERRLYSAVDYSVKSTEWLMAETGISAQKICQVIIHLQMKGMIKEVGKGYFVKQ